MITNRAPTRRESFQETKTFLCSLCLIRSNTHHRKVRPICTAHEKILHRLQPEIIASIKGQGQAHFTPAATCYAVRESTVNAHKYILRILLGISLQIRPPHTVIGCRLLRPASSTRLFRLSVASRESHLLPCWGAENTALLTFQHISLLLPPLTTNLAPHPSSLAQDPSFFLF